MARVSSRRGRADGRFTGAHRPWPAARRATDVRLCGSERTGGPQIPPAQGPGTRDVHAREWIPRARSQLRGAGETVSKTGGRLIATSLAQSITHSPQVDRLGSPSTSQSSQSARGRILSGATVPDDARSYASFQSTAFSVRSGFTYKPNEEREDRIERSLSPSPGYDGGEHEADWRLRLRARNC